MEVAVPATVDGLVLAAMYILVALGFALALSIMGIFNIAHGAICMVGAFICQQLAVELGVNQWLSLLVSVLAMGLFGLFLERFCFRRFYGDINAVIIMATALILILEQGTNLILGGETQAMPSFVPGVITAGAISLGIERLVTFVIGGVLLLALTMFVGRAKAGQQMLAVSQDTEGALLQGISMHRVSALACFIGCSLAAAAGSLLAAIFMIHPFMGGTFLIKAVQLVLISGIGSIGGLLAAGAIIGFIDAIVPLFTSVALAQTIGFLAIIIILLLRPKGLFGYELF